MRTLLGLISLILLFGCGGRNYRPPVQPNWNVTPGQSPTGQPPSPNHTVFFQGPVRYQKILWSEGMTLSRAILTAQYVDRRNPRTIVVVRRGEPYQVDPNSILRGEQDPVIEPGDLIQISP